MGIGLWGVRGVCDKVMWMCVRVCVRVLAGKLACPLKLVGFRWPALLPMTYGCLCRPYRPMEGQKGFPLHLMDVFACNRCAEEQPAQHDPELPGWCAAAHMLLLAALAIALVRH